MKRNMASDLGVRGGTRSRRMNVRMRMPAAVKMSSDKNSSGKTPQPSSFAITNILLHLLLLLL